MHVAFICIPASGHINPTLALVSELVRRGHTVSYATSARYAQAVEAAGATFIPTGEDLPSWTPLVGGDQADPGRMAGLMTPMMERLISRARDEFPGLVSRLRESQVDAVCYDAMTFTGRMAAEKLTVPGIALVPTYASNEHFSLRELMPAEMPPEMVEAWQHLRQLTADFALEQGVSPAGLMESPPESLNIVFIPRDFQPAADTFDERFHFVGPSLGLRASDESWKPAEGAKPLLFISLGTTPLNNRSDFFRLCLEAFRGSPWHVALSIGEYADRAELGVIPENFEVQQSFPQPAVLRHADVFLSHAGMNSTMESLYFAVPMVAVPLQPEQEANARRVEDLGLGRRLDIAVLTADVLRSAVEEVSADQQIRRNLAAMSVVVRAAGGAVAAADAIEAHLDSLQLNSLHLTSRKDNHGSDTDTDTGR